MGFFRGQLNRDRPFKGVQCVLYTLEGEKLDIDVTDDGGYYGFEGIPDGTYQVRFYGRNYTVDDWITIVILDGVSPNSNYIQIILDKQPNKDGWHNETINWHLRYDSNEFDAYYKIWAEEYLLSAGDPPLPEPGESPEIQNVSITPSTNSLDVDYNLTNTPTELYYSVETGQSIYDPNNLGSQTEPTTWTAWGGIGRQIEITGRWWIEAIVVNKGETDLTKIAGQADSVFIKLDKTVPVWNNPGLTTIRGAAGGLTFTYAKDTPELVFGSNMESYSGNHVIQVRGGAYPNFENSVVLGEFPEGRKTFTYMSLSAAFIYPFVTIVNEADNHSAVVELGGPYELYSMTPSNLDDELTVIYEDQAPYNDFYYQVIYSLTNRTNMILLLTDAATSVEKVQYIRHDPDFEPAGQENESNTGEFRNWHDVEDLKINDITETLPWSTPVGPVHTLKFKKVETRGIRVKFTNPANSILGIFPEDGRKGFNVIESLAAESFVGQTFEFQRNIRFLNDLGNERMTFDENGIRGWLDYVNKPNNHTFDLGLGGDFFVGYEGWTADPADDTYIKFTPTRDGIPGKLTIRGDIEVLGGSIGITNFTDFDDSVNYNIGIETTWDKLKDRNMPDRFKFTDLVPLESGLYLAGNYLGFWLSEDTGLAQNGIPGPNAWTAFIKNTGEFAFTDGNNKGIMYRLTANPDEAGNDNYLNNFVLDVDRFFLRGVLGTGSSAKGLSIDSDERAFTNITGIDINGEDQWNFKIKADMTLAQFSAITPNTIKTIAAVPTTISQTPILIPTETTDSVSLNTFEPDYVCDLEYVITVFTDNTYGTVAFQGLQGGVWQDIQSTTVENVTGSAIGINKSFTGLLRDYSDIRFIFKQGGQGSVRISTSTGGTSSPTLGQYAPKTLVNKDGMYSLVAPNNIIPITGASGISGGGGLAGLDDTVVRTGDNYPADSTTVDIGSSTKKYKDEWLAGISYAADHKSDSDRRVKTIHKQGNPLKLLKDVKAYNFTKRGSTEKQWGVIAQELQRNDPDLVSTQKDKEFGEILNVSSLSIASLAAAGVDELHKKIKKLEGRIKELEGK